MVFGKHRKRRDAFFVTNGKGEVRCRLASGVCFSQAQVPNEDNPWDKLVDQLARVTNGNKD